MSSVARTRRPKGPRAAFFTSARGRDLLIVGALALALRAAWVLVYGRTASGLNDTQFYEVAARALARGDGYISLAGEATAHWPPGFPFVVSLLYRAFGQHAELALGLNVVLATATAVLMYLIGERMFGQLGGRIAGVGFAILPGPIFLTALFLSETLFTFMLVGFLALVLFLRERGWTPFALGVAVGLTALTRGEGFLLLIIPLAFWWGSVPSKEWWSRVVLLLAATVLTVVPWTIRNASTMHAFIPVSTNASTTLYSGHNPKANGGPTYVTGKLLAKIHSKDPQQQEVGEARVARQEALEWAVRNPQKELGLIPRRLIALNGGDSTSLYLFLNAPGDHEVHTSGQIVFGVLGDAGGYFVLFVCLASLVILGARRLWRLHPGMRALLAYLALCLVNYGIVYYGQWRYKIPMEPFMLLVATPLLVGAWNQRRNIRAALDRSGEGLLGIQS
jgi:4-amino-4-deoxy-L-arabinose transferase-like glycosyltransferase